VHDQIYPEFERRFVEGMQALRVGDPADLNIDLGPVATQSILADLERQVQTSVEQGARLLLGGGRLDRPGFYFSPTVLADIPRGSPAYQEEVFGPVAMLHRVRDIDEAIHLANDTPFGLGAAAWTRDPGEQERFINEIQAGMVFINAMVASDPRLPFGGVKESGYGRELTELGMYEFMNIKTIWIQEDGEARQTGTE
jgi:succinate-semialdehyde dehydrogenase/glutarate-semialdehyde dehydrogenase